MEQQNTTTSTFNKVVKYGLYWPLTVMMGCVVGHILIGAIGLEPLVHSLGDMLGHALGIEEIAQNLLNVFNVEELHHNHI